MTAKKNKGLKRTKKEWEESIAGHVGRLVDRTSIEDWVKLALFGAATVVSKEIGIVRWQPAWAEPTPRQETLNWLTHAIIGYALIYQTEAVAEGVSGILQLVRPAFIGGVM